MSEDRLDRIEERLASVERMIAELDARSPKREAMPIAAPPVQAKPPTFDIPKPTAEIPAEPHRDAEYLIGAQWLPRIGAFLMILGIAYLIGLAVTKGWITPPMLFGGAVILCLAFIGVGTRLRDAREDFGQILIGIGSCGMFATIAGGHVYQDLYSGESMVLGFLAWSLANLAYAFFRRSRAFLTVGVVGGLIAAVMPLSEHDFPTSLLFHFSILLIAGAIVVRHKFDVAALGVWFASGIALLPIIFDERIDWRIRVCAIYASGLISLLAYLFGRTDSKHDDTLLIGLFTGGSALAAFAVQNGVLGAQHSLIAAALCAVLAVYFRDDRKVAAVLGTMALAIGTMLAPFGLPLVEASLTLAAISIVASVLAWTLKRDHWVSIALCHLVLSGGAFLVAIAESQSGLLTYEPVILSTLLAASAKIAIAIGRKQGDPRLIAVYVGGWAIVSRFAATAFASPTDLKLASFTITVAWVAYGAILLGTGFVASLRNYRYAGLAVLLAAVSKVMVIDMLTATPELRVAVLLGAGVTLVAGGYAYVKRRKLV